VLSAVAADMVGIGRPQQFDVRDRMPIGSNCSSRAAWRPVSRMSQYGWRIGAATARRGWRWLVSGADPQYGRVLIMCCSLFALFGRHRGF